MIDNYKVLSQAKEEEVNRSMVKVFILALVGAALGVLAVYATQLFFVTGDFRSLVGSIVAGFFFLIALVLQGFFVKGTVLIRIIAALQGLIPLVLFFKYLVPVPSVPLIVGAVLMALFLAGGVSHGAHLLKSSMNIHFFSVARGFLPKLLTGVLLFTSVLFFLNYFVWGNFSEPLGRRLVTQTLKTAEPVVYVVWSGARFDQTVGEMLERVAEKQLRSFSFNVGAGEEELSFSRLPPALQKQAIQDAAEKLRVALSQAVGPLNAQDTVTDAAYRIVANAMARVAPGVQVLAGIVFALVFFLTLKGFFSLFLWLVAFVAFLFAKLLVALGFAHISTETVMREFVML